MDTDASNPLQPISLPDGGTLYPMDPRFYIAYLQANAEEGVLYSITEPGKDFTIPCGENDAADSRTGETLQRGVQEKASNLLEGLVSPTQEKTS